MKQNILNGKTILLGVTGSIAAFKSPLLVRELVKEGANVHVLMTNSGAQFATPVTMANVSRNPVIIDMFDKDSQTSGAWHINLAHSCDAMIIAPCSATTLGKLASAICDTPLVSVATALPPEIPLIVSPAMDSTMWMHPATQRSLETVKQDGAIILPPVEGDLSSGFSGPGRFPEIEDITAFIKATLSSWGSKLRYRTSVTHTSSTSAGNHYETGTKKEKRGNVEELLKNPNESLQDSVDKDKWNAEFELDQLKKKPFLNR